MQCVALAALLLQQGAVTLQQGATTKRGEQAEHARLGGALARLPLESTFSFTLGGAPSSHLLPAWNRTAAAFRGRKPSSGREAVAFTRERVVYFQPTPPRAGVVPGFRRPTTADHWPARRVLRSRSAPPLGCS